jgi:hypothetical protein
VSKDKPTTPRREMVKASDIKGVLCGWAGCGESAEYGAAGLLPEGWRSLVMTKYSLLDAAGVFKAERDMMLCPAHVEQLKRLLKQVG